MTATAEKLPKPVITPMRAYSFVTVLLVLLVSAPFTVGVGVAHVCDFILALDAACHAWVESSPLTSWLLTAGVGFVWASYLLALCLNEKALFKSAWRCGFAAALMVFLVLMLEYLFLCLPTIHSLFAAFAAAGGTPVWLSCVSAGVLIIFANALHIVVVLGFMAAAATADFS